MINHLFLKKYFEVLTFIIIFCIINSCSKNIFGKYNTNYSQDKSSFFQMTFNLDGTVEKTEIHTIRIFAKGKFKFKNKTVICYLDSTKFGFPPETLIYKVKSNKIYPIKKGVINRKFYLKKVN